MLNFLVSQEKECVFFRGVILESSTQMENINIYNIMLQMENMTFSFVKCHTVPPESMDPSGRGKTEVFPLAADEVWTQNYRTF